MFSVQFDYTYDQAELRALFELLVDKNVGLTSYARPDVHGCASPSCLAGYAAEYQVLTSLDLQWDGSNLKEITQSLPAVIVGHAQLKGVPVSATYFDSKMFGSISLAHFSSPGTYESELVEAAPDVVTAMCPPFFDPEAEYEAKGNALQSSNHLLAALYRAVRAAGFPIAVAAAAVRNKKWPEVNPTESARKVEFNRLVEDQR